MFEIWLVAEFFPLAKLNFKMTRNDLDLVAQF